MNNCIHEAKERVLLAFRDQGFKISDSDVKIDSIKATWFVTCEKAQENCQNIGDKVTQQIPVIEQGLIKLDEELSPVKEFIHDIYLR